MAANTARAAAEAARATAVAAFNNGHPSMGDTNHGHPSMGAARGDSPKKCFRAAQNPNVDRACQFLWVILITTYYAGLSTLVCFLQQVLDGKQKTGKDQR